MPDPLSEFDRLQDEINRLFDFGYSSPAATGLLDRRMSPMIDVVETDDAVKVYADLPGVGKDEVDLSIASNVLTIKGEKQQKDEKNKEKDAQKNYRDETWAGSFQRTLSLPESVDPQNVEASMKDGVLTVVLGKKEEVKPRQIDVKVK
jgi:HSP20 family protein